MRKTLLSLATAWLVNCSPVAAVPLVQNGDFAEDFASGDLPWITTGMVSWVSNLAAITRQGTLTQTGTTPLVVGDPYRLTFDLEAGALNEFNTLTVFYGATLLATLDNIPSGAFAVVVNFSPINPLDDFLRFSFTDKQQSLLEDITLDNIALVNLNAKGVPEVDFDSFGLPLAAALLLLAIRKGQNEKGRNPKDAPSFV